MNVMAVQKDSTSVRVFWSPPMLAIVMPTGYRIYCDRSNSTVTGNVAISDGLMDNWSSAGSELSHGVLWQKDTLGW